MCSKTDRRQRTGNSLGSNQQPPCRSSLTILRLPPLQLPLGLEGGDDVLNQVAVGVAIAIVRQPRITGEAFLLLLVDEVKANGSTFTVTGVKSGIKTVAAAR